MTPDPAGPLVRAARPEDAPLLAEYNLRMAWETEKQRLDPARVSQGVLNGLNRPDRCRYYVVELQGRLVAQAMVTYEWSDWRNGEIWWLQSVYVHPDFRRRGLFRRLWNHIETLAREAPGVVGLRLYVEQDNRSGQSVYQRLGLRPAGYLVYERMLEGPGQEKETD